MTATTGKTALIIGQRIPGVVDTVEAQAGHDGLQYLDCQGATVRW